MGSTSSEKRPRALAHALVSAVLILGVLAACSSGTGSSESATISSAASGDGASTVETFSTPTDFTSEEARQGMLDKAAGFPSKFDLRDVDGQCYVTPVRAQYPFGNCWGFAAVASAETSILSSVLADDPQAYKTLNLSEKHLTYFSHMYIDDPSSLQNGEGMHVRDEAAEDGLASDDIYGGGTTFLASDTFASGMGPVNESRGVEFEYRGANGTIETDTAADGTEYDFCYSADDDWSLDESDRFLQDYVLKEAYLLPCPAQFKADDSSDGGLLGDASSASASAASDSASASSVPDISSLDLSFGMTYCYNEAATAAIKDQLLQKHAVTIGFHADTSRPWQDGSEGEFMNAKTWAHYTWRSVQANHAVTIVGWDDDYPASNFSSANQPPADGAWLVKNSWGAGTNDFPDRGTGQWGIPVELTDADGNPVLDEDGNPVMVGSGYFWLSYYDQSISDPEVLIFDTAWNDPSLGQDYFLDEVHRHQYDLMPATTMNAAKSADELKTANVFTAEADENLICVSFEIASPGTTVDYEVYLLSPGFESPEDGVLMASGQQTYQYGGYYMEFLRPYVALKQGQSYSIVVTQQLDTGEYTMNAPMGMGKDSAMADLMSELATPQYAVAVVNEGESLVYANGAWQDWSGQDVRNGLLATNPMAQELLAVADAQFDNFPLKGFAIDTTLDGALQLADGSQELSLKAGGDAVELDVQISGTVADVLELSDCYITWSLAPGGDELVKLEPSEDGTQAKVTGLAAGKTYLFVTDVSLGTTIIPVEVS